MLEAVCVALARDVIWNLRSPLRGGNGMDRAYFERIVEECEALRERTREIHETAHAQLDRLRLEQAQLPIRQRGAGDPPPGDEPG